MPFQPGQSGNPAGRARGSRNKRTVIVEKLWDDNAGDPAALRACLDRVAPRRQPLDFDLPQLVTLADAPVAINAIAQGFAHGELDLEQAAALLRIVREFPLAVERERRAAAPAAQADDDGDASGGQSLAEFVAACTR